MRFEVEDDAWRALPLQLQSSIAARTVADIAADVAAGAAFGGFDDDDVHLSRLVFELDERGRRELAEALRETIVRADAIAEASARRGEAARTSVLAVLHFCTSGM